MPGRDAATEIALADLKVRAKALDDIQSYLLRQLEEVRTSRRTIQEEIAGLTNNTAPISSLPNELLIVIFEKLRPLARTSSQKRNFPLVLCRVTRRWRSVVINTSSLWTSIELSSESTDLLDVRLKRSRGSQLEIVYDDVEEGPDPMRTLRNLGHVLPHIKRVRQIRIFSESLESIHLILSRLSCSDALSLEHIAIVCLDSDPSDDAEYKIYLTTHAGSAPGLTSLDLTGNIALSYLPSLDTITTLKLRDIDTDTSPKYRRLFELFGALTSLTSLYLHGRVVHYGLVDRLPTVEIASLLHLSISLEEDPYDEEDESFFHPDYVARVCKALVTPSLQSLALHRITPQMFSYFSTSLPTQPSRYPVLKTFEISNSILPADSSMIHLMQALPSIAHFSVFSVCATDIVELLLHNAAEVSSSNNLFWPMLQVITIVDMPADSAGVGSLLRDLVSSRVALASPLTKLRLLASRSGQYLFLNPEDVGWLQERLELEPVFEVDTYIKTPW